MNDIQAPNTESRVLVLPSTPKDFGLTREILERAGVESVQCSDVDDLCKKMLDGVGAVLIVEEALARTENQDLFDHLAGQPSWSDLPVLVLARAGADSARIAVAMDKLGNVTVLERPLRIVALVSAVRSALRARLRQYQVRDDAKQIEASRDELDIRVRVRTAELQEANSRLEEKMRETEAAERRAHELLRQLVNAEESERARISRDLHDELGQQLTSLRLHLAEIDRDLPKGSKARAALTASLDEAGTIDSRVSFLAWTIRPTAIEELGLSEALCGYVREWSRNFGIAAECHAGRPPQARLVPEIEVNVYRIAQECLNNIAKHAKADTVSVLLTINERDLSLIVEDDGEGFDTTAARQPASDGGVGLSGMQERAELLQGTFQIESSELTGTTVYIRIPAKYRTETAPSNDEASVRRHAGS